MDASEVTESAVRAMQLLKAPIATEVTLDGSETAVSPLAANAHTSMDPRLELAGSSSVVSEVQSAKP